MKYIFRSQLHRWTPALIWVYFTILFAWLAAYIVSGDRFGYVALANSMAVILFIPLPLTALANIYLRRRELWLGACLGAMVFAWLWGGLFVPRLPQSPASGQVLTIMTYNVLGSNRAPEPVIDVLLRSNADVVAIQELNPQIAAAIQNKLSAVYPYQILDPQAGVTGSGVISKFPFWDEGPRLPLDWVGIPQVLSLDWNGVQVHIVNFHMWAPTVYPPQVVWINFRMREHQAQALVDFANSVGGPVILAGDANATHLNDAYKLLNASLTDAWAEAGFGFGNTFPGSSKLGGSFLLYNRLPIPQWLARIDYIFLSSHFQVLSAQLAPFDQQSDHRGVVTQVMLLR